VTDLANIYDQYFRDVYLFALSLSRNETIAEEITQETFFKALKNIDKFKGNCKISVWLCQIAKNTYYTNLERERRFGTDSTEERACENSIEEMLLDKEAALRIHRALHCLEEPYKEVFTLRIFGELSFSQISELFEKTESWSRVTFYRAKQKIQDLLKEVKYINE
jgi:RNA polymerase sigma-70 factor (ECF subfamily)